MCNSFQKPLFWTLKNTDFADAKKKICVYLHQMKVKMKLHIRCLFFYVYQDHYNIYAN